MNREEKDMRARGRDTSAEGEDLSVIDGELLEEDFAGSAMDLAREEKTVIAAKNKKQKDERHKTSQKTYLQYLVLPWIFLTATLFGGLRFAEPGGAFVFLKPALVCLIFASILILLFFRARLIRLEGWFSEDFSTIKNAANGLILLTLFTASVQVFNALLPERGLPFRVVAFCFFWTLWNNIFAEFEVRKLLKSLGAMFALAFVVKYLILASLTAPTAESWWQALWQNPGKEAATWLLDLPRFSAATGYVQFFTLVFYLLGLFLLEPTTNVKTSSSDKISLRQNSI